MATSQCRSRENSLELAKKTVIERLTEAHISKTGLVVANDRKKQVGSGMRGDKVRTYREQDGIVTDHRNGAKASLKLIEQGRLELLR